MTHSGPSNENSSQTELLREGEPYESEEQKDTLRRLIRLGGKQDKDMYYLVWLLGRCIIVNHEGDVDEL